MDISHPSWPVSWSHIEQAAGCPASDARAEAAPPAAVRVQAPQRSDNAPVDTAELTGSQAAAQPACLSPPQAPKAQVTDRTKAAFGSLMRSVNDVLGVLQIKAAPIDFTALTPHVPLGLPGEAQAPHAKALAQAASGTLRAVAKQFDILSHQDQFVAFMMLRLESHTGGLNIHQQVADMASAVREGMLGEQRLLDQKAARVFEQAMGRQAHMDRTSLVLRGLTSVVTGSVALLLTTSGPGLGLTLGAIGMGFVIGGTMGPKRNQARFDLGSAFEGATVGAVAVPLVDALGMAYATIARMSGAVPAAWASEGAQGIASALASGAPGGLEAVFARVSSSFEHLFERYVLGAMQGLGPQARSALWATGPVLRTVSGVYETAENYRITHLNLQGRTAQNLGRMCQQSAKVAQHSWQETTSFLSFMQEGHNAAIEQVLQMLTMHHQTALRAASLGR